MNDNIFVFVIAFNEDELLTTVESAYLNASDPEKLFFGIYEQRTDDDFIDLSNYKNVKKVECKYEYPRGTGIARLNAFMLHNNEHYCMYIDSHTIFDVDWDLELKSQINQLKKVYDKPFISQELPNWSRDKDGNIKRELNFNPSILKANKKIIDKQLHYVMSGESFKEKFKEHYLCSGMYAFGYMDAFKICMPDPRTFFYGEEQLLAIRLSTRGWRIFAFNETYLYHKGINELELQEKKLNDTKFWRNISNRDDYFKSFGDSDLEYINIPASGASYSILSGQELGYWGAPDLLSYEEYIKNLGFDYRTFNRI
jgi:hypothetical protein